MAKPKKKEPEQPALPVVYDEKTEAARQRIKARRKKSLQFEDKEKGGITCTSMDGDFNFIALCDMTGTTEWDSAQMLLDSLLYLDPKAKEFNGAVSLLHGIHPQNEIEGMLATQMIACHKLGMDFLRRTQGENLTHDSVDRNTNRATKMFRNFALLTETLHKLRNGGQQKIVVQHQNIQAQAGSQVIGNAIPGGGVGG